MISAIQNLYRTIPKPTALQVLTCNALIMPFAVRYFGNMVNQNRPGTISERNLDLAERHVVNTFLVLLSGWVFRKHVLEILEHTKILDGRIIVDKTYLEL